MKNTLETFSRFLTQIVVFIIARINRTVYIKVSPLGKSFCSFATFQKVYNLCFLFVASVWGSRCKLLFKVHIIFSGMRKSLSTFLRCEGARTVRKHHL